MSSFQLKLVVALILLGFAFLIFKYDSSEGGLSVSLACDDGMTGTLSVSNLEKAPNTKKVNNNRGRNTINPSIY